MAFNLGAFLQGGTSGYKFVKDMQGQEEDRARKKLQGDREEKQFQREEATALEADNYKKGQQSIVKEWAAENGFEIPEAPKAPAANAATQPAGAPPVNATAPDAVAAPQLPPASGAGVNPPPAANGVMPQEAPAITAPPASAPPINAAPVNQPARPMAKQPSGAQLIDLQTRMAKYDLQNGKTENMMKLFGTMQKIKSEGVPNALPLFASGQNEAGMAAYNSAGDGRYKFVSSEDGVHTTAGGTKTKTKIITMEEEGTGKRVVVNIAELGQSLMDAEKTLEGARKDRELGTKEKTADAQMRAAGGKGDKPENNLAKTKDAAQKFGLLFGLGTDAVGNIIVPPTFDPKQKARYLDGIQQIQTLVDSGIPHYEAMNSIAKKMMNEQDREKSMKPGDSKKSSTSVPDSIVKSWK
jgi:hypothetical protein